ncbi:NUDIX hydrolase [Amycolatopsis sp. CA-230715]|uniref:NUDIX hydrolase n=1 Tax=Amycolatopsis sp. CA-230715 TaxID=2745196 RepID=UPI001C02B996|nr:NUDIX hydrolase [Amycolatopsis sp. CA-230715]
MAVLPIRDRMGNTLVDVRLVADDDLVGVVEPTAVPASVVVVVHHDVVLMMFDRSRKQWELPGGMREQGETARQAATRELLEETGIGGVGLIFAAVAEFDLTKPPRRELLAVYRAQLQSVPRLVVNDEADDFRWWHPADAVSDDMSPLDSEIARRVFHSTTT